MPIFNCYDWLFTMLMPFFLYVVSINSLSPITFRGKIKILLLESLLSNFKTVISFVSLNSSLLLGTQTAKQTLVHSLGSLGCALIGTSLPCFSWNHPMHGSTLVKMQSHAYCCGVLSFAHIWPTFFCSVSFPSLAKGNCFSSSTRTLNNSLLSSILLPVSYL